MGRIKIQRLALFVTVLLFTGLAGCGGSAGANVGKATSTAEAVRTSTAATLPTVAPTAVAATPTQTRTSRPSPTPTKRAKPNPSPSSGASAVLSASVTPATVAAGGRIHATVVTSGAVSHVDLYVGSGLPNAPAPITYALIRSAPGTWVGTGSAPSVAGQYHFTVGLFNAAGQVTHKDNDGWNIVVHGGSPTKSPQPLPVDIPLAVPFSFGNPTPVVFSALGKSISGSEVISNTLPNVSPSVVVRFYETQLPRAGWTTSAAPPKGATSFTISGTKAGTGGTRVCVVQFGGGTVHIFYGTG